MHANKIVMTGKLSSNTCVLCDRQFDTKDKGLRRTNVFIKIKRKDFTVSDALKLLAVVVLPLKVKEKYCCDMCTAKVRDLYSSYQSLNENKQRVEDIVSPVSYVRVKRVSEVEASFSTSQKGLKRLSNTPLNTPLKQQYFASFQSSPKTLVYQKTTCKKGRKVTLNLKAVGIPFLFDVLFSLLLLSLSSCCFSVNILNFRSKLC